MNRLITQHVALDDTLVAPKDRVVIGKCNRRINPTKTQKEAIYQVVLDTLTLSSCYNAFLIIDDVPEIYMHQFWFTISKIKDSSSYQFKLDNKKFRIDFVELIWEDIMFQIDNRQTSAAIHENMPYPRFTKAIIQHFISKDKFISMRNRLFMHSIMNDSVLGRLKFVAKNEDSQVYGKMIPDVMVNDAINNSTAYQTYRAFITGAAIPKKAKKGTKEANVPKMKDSFTADDNIITNDPEVALELGKSISKSDADEQEEARRVQTHEHLVTGVIIRDTPYISKKQNPELSMKLKGIEFLSDATQLVTDTQKAVKASIRESRKQFQPGDSSEGASIILEVPDETKDKSTDSSEGAGTSPEVDWLSINEDEAMDDDDEDVADDKSIDILEIDDERTESDNDDVEMANATKTNADKAEEEKNVKKAEEEKKEEELKGDDQAKNEQAVGPVLVTHKDKPDLLLSTSSHLVSSNFEITSLMDIEIQHVVPNIQQDPLHEVLVSVISTPATLLTTPPPITPPPATTTEAPIPPSSESETLTTMLQRHSVVE
ncbi:hypothetical protein Tco_1419212 [Tanacetum coccineum]